MLTTEAMQPDAPLSATTRALLVSDDGVRRAMLDPSIVDVSQGEGVPIGPLGSGHSVFGRSGFQRVAFHGAPDMGHDFSAPRLPADFAFYLLEGERLYVLQDKTPRHLETETGRGPLPMERVLAYAELPKAHFRFERRDLALDVVMTAFSPLIAHDLETSTTPAQVFELTVENPSDRVRSLELRLSHVAPLRAEAGIARWTTPEGEVAFGADGDGADERGVFARFELAPGARRTTRFFVTWYFSEFKTPSPAATATYRRFYTRRFADAAAVLAFARQNAGAWSSAVDAWRASFQVPAPMKRLWFSSLASVITSTMLSDDPFFFAIESPHEWVNTMDVAVYANWVYLVNWPELERMDLDQYLRVIETEGAEAGFVWHSLWSDAAHYAEEPTFLTRVWRAHRWFNDQPWLRAAYDRAVAAANYAYRHDHFEALLSSKKGNQSYDEWMMPGVSAYVNVAWLHALYALERMGRTLGEPAPVDDTDAGELRGRVLQGLERWLWTDDLGGYYRCFARTPGASEASVPEAVFTDQLFGRWVLLIDGDSADVLPRQRVEAALATVFTNNLLEDTSTGFRGWVNGKLPGGAPDLVSGYHARTCWVGAQLDLASLLGSVGEEARSLDVFLSLEKSLFDQHLAVGEWNRAVDASGGVTVVNDFGKDTPRFPPYPRYTSAWEYLVRMLGLTLTERHAFLDPFRSLAFELRAVRLAGMTLSVRVEAGWTHVLAKGLWFDAPVRLRRDAGVHELEFVRR
jgi:uncharacterized protein (DUF608 family)